jgi:hypothetical protein
MKQFLPFLLILFCSITFVNGQDFNLSTYSNSNSNLKVVGVGDIDNDGYSDIITSETYSLSSEIYLLKSDKSLNVSSFTKELITKDVYISGTPSLVDLNIDGNIDFVYTSLANNEITILLNDGKGKFTSKSLGVGGADIFKFMDMDNDKDLDIVGISDNNRTLTLFTQTANLTFTKKSLLPGNSSLSDFALVDFDNNGLPEIVLSYYSFSGTQLIYLENKGFTTISNKTIIKGKYSEINRLEIGDLNNDGKDDIVVVDKYDLVVVTNNGNFTFTDKVINPTGSGSIVGADFADLTGEGKKDFVVCTIFNTYWLKNTDVTNYVFEKKELSNATGITDFHFGDFNKDGALDFAYSSNGLKIMVNKIPQQTSTDEKLITNHKAYPNPTKDLVDLEGIDGHEMVAHFYNQTGRKVLSANVSSGTMDISSLVSGTFFYTIIDGSNKVVGRGKIIKV